MSSAIDDTDSSTLCRDYKSEEYWAFRDFKRTFKDSKYFFGLNYVRTQLHSREDFRTRRCHTARTKALRFRLGHSDEVGTFLKLTDGYALIGGEHEKSVSLLEADLPQLPVINTTIAGCSVIGCMCVGNKKGLLLPDTTYDTELLRLKSDLPEGVEVRTIEEKLSALGNVIVCNDRVALIHPDLDKETEEIISDTLQVEVFRHSFANPELVGSVCIINKYGGLVRADTSKADIDLLSNLLELPIKPGTVNGGSNAIGSGLALNSDIAYTGMKTLASEIQNIECAFNLHQRGYYQIYNWH